VKEITVTGTRSQFTIAPGTTVSQDYLVFAGPLWKELLDGHPAYQAPNLTSLVDYPSWIPGVRFLAIFLTKVLVGFHWLTRSWGLSIILLTVLVRACLHPLMVKQTKSTQKMQLLAPETAKLKEKYQDKDGNMSTEDQRKFQAEQMELWKKHGINPLGCMGPMILQLPIFIGLWNALRYAFELRQSSFLWIRDLTEPDVIARLPFTLPMHGTNALCILPLVMLVVYVLQMKTMPKSADPQQAEQQKMMQWIMPVMGYMFYSMQSGLLLYYITSSLLGMVEQRWIKKRLGIVAPGAGLVPAKV
jgi:YidC/Oxa1 family membrane protein insertase